VIFGEGRARDLYRRAVWGPGRRALDPLPPPWEMRAVRAAGRLAAAALPATRAHLRENLGRAFPARDDLDAVARDAVASHFSNQYVGFSFPRCTADNWQRYLHFAGLERLAPLRTLGRGLVLAHPHMGPAQLPLHVLGLLGWPMHQVGGGRVTRVELSETGQWASDTRASLEAAMPVTLHDGRGFIRPVLRALGQGGVVMTACDGTGGGEELGRRLPATVLGQPMPLPVGAVWLAWKAEVPLFGLVCHRRRGPGAPFAATVGPELVFARTGGRDAVLADGVRALAAFLDGALRAHPGDWHFWDSFQPGRLLAEDA
jgi:lauroyl/myristoyl acyltransferase